MKKKTISKVNKKRWSDDRSVSDSSNAGFLSSEQFAHFRTELSPSGDSRSIETILAIRSVAHLIESKLSAWIAPSGLSLGQFNVLMSLWGSPNGQRSMSEVTRALVSSPANATKLVIQLEAKGYVERGVDPSDKRVVMARLTKKGKQKMGAIAPPQIARIEAVMKPVQGWVCEALIEYLRQVQKGFQIEKVESDNSSAGGKA